MADERPLRSILSVLDPYLNELVLIGGWVPYLQLRYGRASEGVADARTSRTMEADVLVPSRLPSDGRRPLTEILHSEGFRAARSSGAHWRRDVSRGEEIEFFQVHRGTARELGRPELVEAQPELWALSLDNLDLLSRFVEEVELPETTDHERVVVRVPTLGAFVVAKASTFAKRSGDDRAEKGGKDLLYVRDVAAAGQSVTEVLKRDLEIVADGDASSRRSSRSSENHLRLVLSGGFPEAVENAARELSERDGLSLDAAEVDALGYLADVVEMLESARSPSGGTARESP